MPSGITMASATATKEQVEEVLKKHDYEIDKSGEATSEEPVTPEEPKREAFDTDEAYEAALATWEEESKVEADETKPDSPAKPRVSRFQKRLNKIAGNLQRENKELRTRLETLEKDGKPEPTKEPQRPVRSSFSTTEEYEDALLAWGTEKAIKDKQIKDARDEETTRLQQNQANYVSQVEQMKDEVEDWDETVNQDIPMHTGVQLAIMEQENGAKVIYYLGKHPDYTRKLAEMSPLSAVMEVGRLSERLKSGSGEPPAGSAVTPKPKPRVPAPVRPVNSSATTSTSTARDAAKAGNFRAFEAARRAGR